MTEFTELYSSDFVEALNIIQNMMVKLDIYDRYSYPAHGKFNAEFAEKWLSQFNEYDLYMISARFGYNSSDEGVRDFITSIVKQMNTASDGIFMFNTITCKFSKFSLG